MFFAHLILAIAAVYAAVGVLFALAFVTVGVERIDHAVHGAPLGFRVLILPASVALWPLMLTKWIRS